MSQPPKPSSFISKFHCILKNKNFQRIIKYDQMNSMIHIIDKEKLELEVLPHFYRHNKFTSFIRQLNLYGFKKIKKNAPLTFSHPSLLRGEKFLSIVAKKKLESKDSGEERNVSQSYQQNSIDNNRIMGEENYRQPFVISPYPHIPSINYQLLQVVGYDGVPVTCIFYTHL